jgi:hypothetical protein
VSSLRTPAETLTADLIIDGRRFVLVLVKHLYSNAGVAIFSEVTVETGADGEPKHDVFQDVGTWCIDGGVLKVDFCVSDNIDEAAGSALKNALIEQVGTQWSETWERQ